MLLLFLSFSVILADFSFLLSGDTLLVSGKRKKFGCLFITSDCGLYLSSKSAKRAGKWHSSRQKTCIIALLSQIFFIHRHVHVYICIYISTKGMH